MTDQDSAAAAVPDPSPLIQLSTAYWGSEVLLTANRLGLFALLDGEHLSTAVVARRLGTQERPTALMLKACVALGLLEYHDDHYSNSPLAAAYLVPGHPGFLGNAIRYSDNMYRPWGDLEQALRDDQPTLPAATYLGGDAGQTRDFVYAMHDRALGIGQAMVGLLDLSDRRRLLDVGGGPGTYSVLLTRRYPELRARVMDLPDILAVSTGIISDMGAAGAVDTYPGDYSNSEFPGGNDVVLISGVFHRESVAGCRDLIRKAVGALEPGGLLVVSDVFTDSGGTSPPFATLFGLNMLLSAPDGGVHADADVAGWMADAGLTPGGTVHLPPPMPHRLIIGTLNNA